MNILKLTHLLLFVFCSSMAFTQIVYVKVDGSGDGSSWAEATGDLQSALNAASSGTQIWLAEGVYYPVTCDPCSEIQRSISFGIPDGVALLGGFIGTETNVNQRDWETNPTILSGDINQDGIISNNAQTIVYFSNVSSLTMLDGCVLENGFAHSSNPSSGEKYNSGAAIYNSGVLNGNASHPSIRNCIFRNNEAAGYGGAIYNNGGFSGSTNPVFENCSFINNVSLEAGGAIYNQGSFSGNASCEFSNCVFSNNRSTSTGGGAVYNQGAEDGIVNAVFSNCQFEGNQSLIGHGGAVHSHGRGGISNTTFEDCTFTNNVAQFGGAVSNNGTSEGVANPTFTACHFEENHCSGDGGSVYNWGSEGQSDAYFINSTFEKNNSTFAGAGIFNNGIDGQCNATIINCKFIENSADTYGGAIYNNGKRGFANAVIINSLFLNNSGSSAGGVYNLGGEGGHSSAEVTNCTFYGNTANVGGAIYNNASDSSGTSNPTITNCVFWKNQANFGSVFRNILASPLIQYSVVDQVDCESLNSGLGSEVVCGQTVLFNTYPEFIDSSNYNLRLKANSPILDLGNNLILNDIDFDLDNHDRIENGTVDFGAYEYVVSIEYSSILTQPQSATLCEGDSLTLFVEIEGTAPFVYQWFKNDVAIEGAMDSIFFIDEVQVEDVGDYVCVIQSPVDTIFSDFASLIINSSLTPTIEILASELEICDGGMITFNTAVSHEGNDPVYHWYLNGNPVSENVNALEIENLNNEDWIFVALQSSETCLESDLVFSDTLEVQVNPILEASINILEPDTVVCIGHPARYEADFSNAGLNPSFQWLINNVEVVDANAGVFITNDLQMGDEITCQLTSSESCLFENPIVSDIVFSALDSCNLINGLVEIDDQLISINPNPSQGILMLEAQNLSGNYVLQIVDLLGGIIMNKKLEINNELYNTPITISEGGIYFVRIYNETHFYTQKVIVEK